MISFGKVDPFLDRIAEADNAILIDTREDTIKSLQEEKLIMDETIKNCGRPIESSEDSFRTAAFSQPFLLLADLREGGNEMVGLAGLEPARPYGQQILSLQRLPFRHRPKARKNL